MNTTIKPKQIILLLSFLVLIVIVAKIVFFYLTTGELTITTNGAKSISVTLPSNSAVAINKQVSQLSVRLKSGTYTVTAQKGDSEVKQVATVKARQTTHSTLQIVDVGTIEPVSPRSVVDFFADSQNLIYSDTNNDNFYHVGTTNTENLINLPSNLSSLQWVSSSYGIGQDTVGGLHIIDGGSVTPLYVPSAISVDSFGVSPEKQIFVSDGSFIYTGSGASLKRFPVSGLKHPGILAVANNGDLLLQDDVSTSKDPEPVFDLVTKTADGLSNRKRYDVGHSQNIKAAWSPDNQKIIISTQTETTINDKNLQLIFRLPSAAIVSPTWFNNSIVVYGTANKLWAYNLDTKSSYVLATTYNQQSITGVYSGHDNTHVYVRLQNSSTGQQLGRIDVTNPHSGSDISSLGIILPTSLGECSIGYINFTGPTVIAYGPNSSETDCISQTKNYLNQYGSVVNVRKLAVVFNGS